MSQVSETLAAWREAERRLKVTDDPREIPALVAEVARLQEAYRTAVDPAGEFLGDVTGHVASSDEPKP